MNDLLKGVLIVICLYFAGLFGWLFAHATIARECERLGGFYYGQWDYACQKIPVVRK